MAIESDVLFDQTNKRIYGDPTFLAGSSFYTSNQVFTQAMVQAYDFNQGDDSVPFGQGSNVLTYILANGWYIQRALIKHIKGASIQTSGYANAIRKLTLTAGHTIVAADVGTAVSGGTTGDTGVLLDVDGNNIWVRMDAADDLFDNTSETITCGSHSGTMGGSASITGECLFSNIVSVGAIAHGFCYVAQDGAVLTPWWGYGNSGTGNKHIDILVEVNSAGVLIDSGNLSVYNRNLGDKFFHVTVDCSGGGRNVAPLGTEKDISIEDVEGVADSGGDGNTLVDAAATFETDGVQAGDVVWNETDGSYATVTTVTDETHLETSALLYGSDNTYQAGDAYRIIKHGYISDNVHSDHGGDGTTKAIAVTFGTFTADIDDDSVNENYKFKVDEEGQAQSLVYNALQWICARGRTQLLNGVPAQIYIAADAAYTPVPSAPLGSMAGSTLIISQGGYPFDIGSGSYISTDNSNVQHTPPNTMSVGVTGTVSGDRVWIWPTLNGAINKAQFTSHASNNVNDGSTFEVQGAIPKDLPQAGYIRVVDVSSGTEQRYQYDSWTGGTFTLNSGNKLNRDYTGSDTAYVGWIDEEASGTSITKNNLQYVAPRPVLVIARNSAPGGNQIIPFQVASTITATGLSIPISRNPDNVIGN